MFCSFAEKISILKVEKYLKHPVFYLVSEAAGELNYRAYVIGGFVRDLFLGHPSKDIDIVVVGNGIELAERVAEKAGHKTRVKVFKNFGTAMLRLHDWEIEFVGARKESYRRNSRKPIVENGTFEDDQKRRDFTINALGISLQKENYGELIDPFNGIEDLKNKLIRTPLDPDITFSDDPLRMMRAVRFSSQLNFRIVHESLEAITRNANRINIVSKERITGELNKIIMTNRPSKGFQILFYTGLLDIIFPEMAVLHGAEIKDGKGHKDNFYHTLVVLDNVARKSDNLWLRWAAILHDIGKPVTKKWVDGAGWTFHGHEFIGSKMIPGIFKRLKLPMGDQMKYVKKLTLLHLRTIILSQETVTDSAVRRLLFEAGDDIDDLMILSNADMSSKIPSKIKKYRANFELVRKKLVEIEKKDRIRNWQPPISGNIIMETFGLPQSREVGIIKTAIREAILEGEIKNDFNEAYNFMLKEGKKLGLKSQKNTKNKI